MHNAFITGLDIETNTGTLLEGDGPGLDPTHPDAHIISVALFTGSAPASEATEPATRVLLSPVSEGEAGEMRLLRELDEYLREIDPSVLVTWNGANFDLPYIFTRARWLGLELGLRLVASDLRPPKYRFCPGHDSGYLASWGQHGHSDIYYAWREWAKSQGIRDGLKPVAIARGLEPIEVDATDMSVLTSEQLVAYNLSDARCTYLLAREVDVVPDLPPSPW